MKKMRICSVGIAAAIAGQFLLPQIPAIIASAAVMENCSLEDFSGEVLAVTQTDASRDFYEAIVYDEAAGTLSADGGAPKTFCGDLQIQNGELLLRTDRDKPASSWESFAENAEEWGYETVRRDGKLTITNEFQTARLIVKAEGSIALHGAESVAEGYHGLHILQYADSAAAYSAYQAYCADSAVEYVQPSHRVTLDAKVLAQSQAYVDAVIADTESGVYNSWGVPLIGTEEFIETYLDAEVLPDVTVAVIDTGINPSPELFAGRILEGGINISDSGDDTVNDDLYHGTHVTGTICEMTPKNVKILPIKVFDEEGSASDEQIYLGVMHAIEQKADIVNMSFGGLGVSPLEIEAMEIADENGMICCAASGNSGDDAGYYYPGSIESCITVGAVTKDMERATFSNYGDSVDLVAPGFGIMSYVLGDDQKREEKNGTSMATPHVSACCALLRSYDKTMTPRRAESLLRMNAVDLGPDGFDEDFAWGFLNMADFRWDDGICPAPEFSAESGNYGHALEIALSVELDDAEIYYTTDSTMPSPENGIRYEKPITVTETTRILAVAVREGWIGSSAAEAVYSIDGKEVSEPYVVKDGVLLTYRGIREKVIVPDTFDGAPLLAIAPNAFSGNRFAVEIQIPESVKTIGDSAFQNCPELERVYAAGVSDVGAEAFADSIALQDIRLSDSVESLGTGAFRGCISLQEQQLAGLTELPEQAFADCTALKTVYLPDVTKIGASAFMDCSALKKPEIYWQNVTAIGSHAFENCSAWEGDLRLASLETLGTSVFANASVLRSVMLPERMTVLPYGTFYHCSGLRQLDLSGITRIGASALATQTGRTVLPTGLDYSKITYVGTGAFMDCLIGNGYDTICFSALEALEYRSFAGANAGTLAFPKLKTVCDSAFADAKIDCVSLEQAETVESRALTGARAVCLTETLQTVAENAFASDVWIVAAKENPAIQMTETMQFCDEPLVMRLSGEACTVTQHEVGTVQVLACGDQLQYQWYRVDGTAQTLLNGADTPILHPDTSAVGTFTYCCVITDAQGKSEQVTASVSVKEAAELPQLQPEQLAEPTSESVSRYQICVPESGTYRLSASGSTAVSGVLCDAAGQTVGVLKSQYLGGELLSVKLFSDQEYYLRTEARWGGTYALYLTSAQPAEMDLAECQLRATVQYSCAYGSGYQPDVEVCLPDGTKLKQDEDYVLRFTKRNQEIRISAYGVGRCTGFCETSVTVYEKIPVDTPVPVEISYEKEEAVYIFVPQKTGKYLFYANCAEGYAAELTQYNRSGRYANGSKYSKIRTKCWVADTPEHDETVYEYVEYSTITGEYFNSPILLNAGQTYYFVCSGSAGAEYRLVISAENYDLSQAVVTGGFLASYEPGESYRPKIKVRIGDTLLTEGKDYQRIDNQTDVPGSAELKLVGMGKYYGTVVKKYEMIYASPAQSETMLELDQPVAVTCTEDRLTNLWFTVDCCETENATVRYRILNERVSGGPMQYTLYRYDKNTDACARMLPMTGEQNDYQLSNGTYLIAVSRQYPESASKANFSVLIPYSITDAVVTVTNQPYTGSEVPLPVTVHAPDGTELLPNRDFRLTYKDSEIMFGTVKFSLYATNRTFGYQEGSFEIFVDLPKDAPLLSVGAHSVSVTKEERLAVYRVMPETDTEYVLCSSDVSDIVLRVFSPEAEMLAQDYGSGAKSVTFEVPAGETRYVMVKFNGTAREGTIHFRLETSLRLLSECEIIAEPQFWTGSEITPQVTFRDGDYTLIEGQDYRLRYTADDVNIGTLTANYIGMGTYFGSCDVEISIVPEKLFEAEFFDPLPLMLDEAYAFDKTEQQYMVFSYTSGIAANLDAKFYDAMCKLSVQCYDKDGQFLQSVFFKSTGGTQLAMQAGDTVYFVISATDISSRNQTFNLLLHDDGSTHMKTVRDEEGGFGYRISNAGDYAEAYEILKTERESLKLLPEIEGVPVRFVPESLFINLPSDMVVIGYAGCPAADYADRNGFIYQQASSSSQTPVTGDLNNDGRCSAADVALLSAMLAEHTGLNPALFPFDAADLNADAILDMQDLLALSKLTAKQSTQP